MLGYSHATSGAVAWLAAAQPIAHLLGTSLTPQEMAAGTIACAGAALIPDLDHPSATIAYTFGPISYGAAKLTSLLSGGHRNGTHSLLFAGGFGFLCYLVGMSTEWFSSAWPGMIMMFCLAAFAFRGMNLVLPRTSRAMKGSVVIAQAAAVTWLMSQFMPETWWWLGLAGALGCITHLVGDTLTPEGVPWFYPKRTRFSLPIISHTGNVLEKAVFGPLLTGAAIWLGISTFSSLLG